MWKLSFTEPLSADQFVSKNTAFWCLSCTTGTYTDTMLAQLNFLRKLREQEAEGTHGGKEVFCKALQNKIRPKSYRNGPPLRARSLHLTAETSLV